MKVFARRVIIDRPFLIQTCSSVSGWTKGKREKTEKKKRERERKKKRTQSINPLSHPSFISLSLSLFDTSSLSVASPIKHPTPLGHPQPYPHFHHSTWLLFLQTAAKRNLAEKKTRPIGQSFCKITSTIRHEQKAQCRRTGSRAGHSER